MKRAETTEQSSIHHVHKLHYWRMAFFGLVILLAGLVIGGASIFILVGRRPKIRPMDPQMFSMEAISDLQHGLGLSAEQSEKIGTVLQKTMQGLHEKRMEAAEEISEQLRQMNEQISAVLTEEQERIWQHRLERLQEQFRPGGPRQGMGFGRGRGTPRGRGGQQGPQERFRRGPGTGPGPNMSPRYPDGPNFPRNGVNNDRMRPDEKPVNEDEKPINEDL